MPRNPLIPRRPRKLKTKPLRKSAGILDDYPVRKNIALKEGTVEHTPTDDKHIANKKYVDDQISIKSIERTILDPYSSEDIDAQIALGWIDNAMTISRIRVQLDADPATEINANLKFADDFVSLANATLIDVIDTTNGTTDNTSGFDDATIPAGKFLYVEFDAQPIAAITQMHIRVDGTED